MRFHRGDPYAQRRESGAGRERLSSFVLSWLALLLCLAHFAGVW